MRALVVEDDELFRLGLEVTLQGFEVIELVTAVGDGEQALDLLRHQSFDVILLDLGLPGLGGWRPAAASPPITQRSRCWWSPARRIPPGACG